MTGPNKAQRQAFDDGAHAKRGGQTVERTVLIFGRASDPDPQALRNWAFEGWHIQKQNPTERVTYNFYLNLIKSKVGELKSPQQKGNHAMRTEDELNALKDEYSKVYTPYAQAEQAAGREPTPFEEAFAAHLEALDEEQRTAADQTVADVDGGATTAKPKGKGSKKPKAETKAKTPKAPKEPKAPRAKAFRPTSEDRKALNTAAAAALKAAKVEGTPRLKPSEGTYSDFLSGKVVKLDEAGNGSTTLNVVTAADMATVVGQVDVTVKKGVMTAKGKKA